MLETPRTRSVNVKHEECDVYIGRAMPGRPGSPFGNIFRIGEDGTREQVIDRYRAWITAQPELMRDLESLRGKRLGCWCKPAQCHADVLVELLEGPNAAPSTPAQGSLFGLDNAPMPTRQQRHKR